jgi:hypothetical protein
MKAGIVANAVQAKIQAEDLDTEQTADNQKAGHSVGQMTADDHNRGVGSIIMDLQSLETHIRYFLYRRDGEYAAFPKPGDWQTRETWLTKFISLGDLIKEYNSSLKSHERALFLVTDSVVDLRDAIAHGRLLAPNLNPPFSLWKFSRPKNSNVRVDFYEEITREWIGIKLRTIAIQRDRIERCFKARKYEGFR